MTTIFHRHFALALAATLTLSLLAIVATPRADAATIYACVKKKSGAARIVTKKAKCKKSESKLSWSSQGSAGPAGKNGANGTNGTNGTNGQNLTTQTPLASGQSESGFYAAASGTSTSGYAGEGVSFAQPLAAPIAEGNVIYNTEGKTSTHCAGFGHADPGYVCLYEMEAYEMSFLDTRDFKLDTNAADKYGFAMFFNVKATGGYIAGSWTVTAS